MSGVAAVVRYDGGDPGPALRVLAAQSSERSPDGWTAWQAPGIALAKFHRLVFDGQRVSSQPALEPDGPHAVVFDGRLDNRHEIAAAEPSLCGDDDDARYALTVAARRGAAVADGLYGDFALLVWNGRTQTLIAARDRLGMRPLYWRECAGQLCLASDVRALLAVGGVPAPDPEAVAGVLHFEPPAGARTLFRGISRVPPGHLLVATRERIDLRRYWRPEAHPADEGRDDGAVADECRTLLERATRARLRARAPAAMFFSGGIDSSAVMAAALAVAGRGEAPAPRAISMVFTQPEADEAEYREAFRRMHQIELDQVSPAPVEAGEFAAQPRGTGVLPDLPGEFVGRPLLQQAQARGARVALTGGGGDFLFSGSTLQYADLLRRGRVHDALKQFRQDRVTDDSGWTPAALLTDGVWPLLPRPVREVLRRPMRRLLGRGPDVPWVRLPAPRRRAVPDPPAGVSHASWEICWGMRNGWTGYFLEATERSAVRYGIESRHPLLDAALVTFALSLPERQRRRGRTTKFVLRQAAALPAAIHARLTKADQGFGLAEAMAALGGRRFFEHLQIAEAGWVDPRILTRSYDRTLTHSPLVDQNSGALLPRLWITAAVELWYRAVVSGRAPQEER